MICKHCEIESSKDEGVEVVRNEAIINENGLSGQLTEKRLYLSRFVCPIHLRFSSSRQPVTHLDSLSYSKRLLHH